MADRTHIQWTDATWSPVTGCTRVSSGCDRCYIERTVPFRVNHRKFDRPGVGGTTGVMLHSDRLGQPQTWRKPRRIFVCSMADLFHDAVPDPFIADVFAVMAIARQHTYQVLTKRPARMRSLLCSPVFRKAVQQCALIRVGNKAPWLVEPWWPLANVWCGVSVETQQWADIRIPILLDTPAAVRWLSCEPLLGPVDLSEWLGPVDWPSCWDRHSPSSECPGCIQPQWIVTGGESGPGARPMHPDWARSLRDQCVAADVPFLFKQWGEYGLLPRRRPDGLLDMAMPSVTVADDGTVYQRGDLSYPDGPRYGEAVRAGHDRAHLHAMYRVGKKTAGRELDDREWSEYPA